MHLLLVLVGTIIVWESNATEKFYANLRNWFYAGCGGEIDRRGKNGSSFLIKLPGWGSPGGRSIPWPELVERPLSVASRIVYQLTSSVEDATQRHCPMIPTR